MKILEDREDKDNKYEYQANVNTLIGSLCDKFAEAVFSRDSSHRQRKMDRIMLEIQKSVVPIRPDNGSATRYENPQNANFHHNKRSNL